MTSHTGWVATTVVVARLTASAIRCSIRCDIRWNSIGSVTSYWSVTRTDISVRSSAVGANIALPRLRLGAAHLGAFEHRDHPSQTGTAPMVGLFEAEHDDRRPRADVAERTPNGEDPTRDQQRYELRKHPDASIWIRFSPPTRIVGRTTYVFQRARSALTSAAHSPEIRFGRIPRHRGDDLHQSDEISAPEFDVSIGISLVRLALISHLETYRDPVEGCSGRIALARKLQVPSSSITERLYGRAGPLVTLVHDSERLGIAPEPRLGDLARRVGVDEDPLSWTGRVDSTLWPLLRAASGLDAGGTAPLSRPGRRTDWRRVHSSATTRSSSSDRHRPRPCRATTSPPPTCSPRRCAASRADRTAARPRRSVRSPSSRRSRSTRSQRSSPRARSAPTSCGPSTGRCG